MGGGLVLVLLLALLPILFAGMMFCLAGIAKNKTLHHFVPPILVKIFPLEHLRLQRVMQHIVANEPQFCFIPNDMIVESLLPQMSPTRPISAFVILNPSHAGNRLIHPHNVT